jgi:hypothetical protein
MSILEYNFMMKYNFYNNIIPQYNKINYITCINNSCLVEDINTKERLWCSRYDIYPLCDKNKYDNYGEWIFDENFDKIAKEYRYL